MSTALSYLASVFLVEVSSGTIPKKTDAIIEALNEHHGWLLESESHQLWVKLGERNGLKLGLSGRESIRIDCGAFAEDGHLISAPWTMQSRSEYLEPDQEDADRLISRAIRRSSRTNWVTILRRTGKL